MKTLWLYAGTQKTATTAVQHFLTANRAVLAERGVSFPDMSDLFDKTNNYRNANWLTRYKLLGERTREGFERIEGLLDECGTVILSDERLWRNVFDQAEFFDFVKAGFSADTNIKVLVFLRRQDQFLYSCWTQAVKVRPAKEESHLEFLDYIARRWEVEEKVLDYAHRLAVVEEGIGIENMVVRTYDPKRYEGTGASIVDDFLEAIGIDSEGEWASPEEMFNESMRDVVLETRRLMNREVATAHLEFDGGDTELRRALLYVQRELEEEGLLGRRTGFPDEKRREMMERYAEGNATVARRYLGREDGVLFDCTDIEEGTGGEAMRPYTNEEIVQVLTRVSGRLASKLDRVGRKARGRGTGDVGPEAEDD